MGIQLPLSRGTGFQPVSFTSLRITFDSRQFIHVVSRSHGLKTRATGRAASIQSCHPERSEGSGALEGGQMLRCAQMTFLLHLRAGHAIRCFLGRRKGMTVAVSAGLKPIVARE